MTSSNAVLELHELNRSRNSLLHSCTCKYYAMQTCLYDVKTTDYVEMLSPLVKLDTIFHNLSKSSLWVRIMHTKKKSKIGAAEKLHG